MLIDLTLELSLASRFLPVHHQLLAMKCYVRYLKFDTRVVFDDGWKRDDFKIKVKPLICDGRTIRYEITNNNFMDDWLRKSLQNCYLHVVYDKGP